MKKIIEIWNDQETDSELSCNLLLRRYSPNVLPDVFVAFRKSEMQRGLALRVKIEFVKFLSHNTDLEVIKLDFMPDESDLSKSLLLILLLSNQHIDVFAALCEDLIADISSIKNEDLLVKELLNRLEKWKALFSKASLDGMTADEQRGLYGELYFLKIWLRASDDTQKCIQSWVGPQGAIRDFQLLDWALEVKTTHGNNHQKIQISSERQLDTSNLNQLFLFHLSLEEQQKNGETLNALIDEIFDMLNSDVASQTQFRIMISRVGYFNHHRNLYDKKGYIIRQAAYYLVKDEFPRIEESEVRKGVGDVKYSIILSENTDYKIKEDSVIEIINRNGK